jgi:hypothetical protein
MTLPTGHLVTGFQVWSITTISQHNSISGTLLEGLSAFQQISCLIFIRIKNVSNKILHKEHTVFEQTLAHYTRENHRASLQCTQFICTVHVHDSNFCWLND